MLSNDDESVVNRIKNSYTLTIKLPTIVGSALLLLAGMLYLIAGMSAEKARIFLYRAATEAAGIYYQNLANAYYLQTFIIVLVAIGLFIVAYYSNKNY